MIHDVVKKNFCILHSLLEKHSKHLWVTSCIAAPFFNSCCVCLVQGPTQSGDAAGISPTLLLPRGISPTPACCLLGPTGAAAKNPSPCLLPLPHQHATHPHGLGEGYQEHHQCIQFMQPTSLSVRSKEKCT